MRTSGQAAEPPSGKPRQPILIGIEYAMPGPAREFAALKVPAVKFYPDEITWGSMQKSPDAAIDFSKLDRLVREYQRAGFQELVICLKSASAWGSKDAKNPLALKNLAPRTEHVGKYAEWIRSVVERYDHDGKDDMPDLVDSVRYYEIGSEYSTFEPEPAAEYVEMLESAYRAAHKASAGVIVLNAGFLTTTALRSHPPPEKYEAAFAAADAATQGRILHKKLADVRAVLDRPDIFDSVSFHALGDPLEIEDTVAWLRHEMRRRKYDKPVVISDTTPTPFIAWGPATRKAGPPAQLGIVVPPATEADRPRLAAYFTKLIDGDAVTTEWTHGFVAADMVQKIVVAAEQGVVLINASFMEDLALFKTRVLMGGAGTSAWGGMADLELNLFTQSRTFKVARPSFHAIGQVQKHLAASSSVERVRAGDRRIRHYKIVRDNGPGWVVWLDPGKLVLPGEPVPSQKTDIDVAVPKVIVESTITGPGQTIPTQEPMAAESGKLTLTITPTPVFISPASK